jgi:catechol 2,3-dioxygenase
VSEAIYLADPDGNGIEIYRDRPRAEWPYVNGVLQMGSKALNLEGLAREPGSVERWDGLPADTRMGHVHLHVSRLAQAERFYTEALGFDLMQRYAGRPRFCRPAAITTTSASAPVRRRYRHRRRRARSASTMSRLRSRPPRRLPPSPATWTLSTSR